MVGGTPPSWWGWSVYMTYVYILRLSNENIYTGKTQNLKRRLCEHRAGGVKSTKPYLPVKLIHYECYLLGSDAGRREIFLKKSQGKILLKKQIRDVLAK